MVKRVVRLFVTHDSPRHRTRDEILHAERVPKLIVNQLVWAGGLRPLIDTIVETLGQLSNGLTSGNTLSAERLVGVVNEGRVWSGSLLSELRAASGNTAAGATVDGTEVLAEAERLDTLLRSAAPNNGPAIADSLRCLRAAADRVGGARTGDSNPLKRLTMLTPEQRQSGPNSPENARAREFWRAQTAPATARPIGDSGPTTAVRNALHAVNHARSERERLERSNELARAFWARA